MRNSNFKICTQLVLIAFLFGTVFNNAHCATINDIPLNQSRKATEFFEYLTKKYGPENNDVFRLSYVPTATLQAKNILIRKVGGNDSTSFGHDCSFLYLNKMPGLSQGQNFKVQNATIGAKESTDGKVMVMKIDLIEQTEKLSETSLETAEKTEPAKFSYVCNVKWTAIEQGYSFTNFLTGLKNYMKPVNSMAEYAINTAQNDKDIH